jgi:hypothetical protein
MRLFAKGLSDMASPKFSGGWLIVSLETDLISSQRRPLFKNNGASLGTVKL